MIEYSRVWPEFVEVYKNYGELYRDDAVHHPTPVRADELLRILADGAPHQAELNALEVGTGLGSFITEFAAHLRATRPQSDILARGIDANPATIDRAEDLHPGSRWVCDTVQGFIADHDKHFPGQRYDFVLDRGGTTRIASESEAERVADGLWSLIKDGGKYAYYISWLFYDDFQGKRMRGHWSRGWIDILRGRFQEAEDLSLSPGPYRHVFTKRA